MKTKKPDSDLIATAKEEIITRKNRIGDPEPHFTKYYIGNWQARRMERGHRVTLRYGTRVVMVSRGYIAWENAKSLVDHFHRTGHVPAFGGKFLADHPRPGWMAPPPKPEKPKAETPAIAIA